MMRFKKLSQKGDTLVEVLISMAILSLVLVGAYVTSNRNRVSIEANQERQEAQRLTEAQIEMLRAHNGIGTSGHCFDPNSAEQSGTNCVQTVSSSGAQYTMQILGPTNGTYTVSATWTSLASKTANDSNVTLYYRLK
jgi:prepilin-type N-terminal cleavage/methylation domain-containing protein